MVTPISANFDALAYLNELKGITPAASSTTTSTTAAQTQTPNAASATPKSQESNNGKKGAALPTDIVTLLQDTASSGQQLSSLLGRNSSDPLAGVYSTFLYNKTAANPLKAAINGAKSQLSQLKTQTQGNVSSILSSAHQASNAYNKTLIQNAKDALNNTGSTTA